MSQQLEHIWSRVQAQLALVVDEPTYRIWLEPLRAVELDDHRLIVDAPAHARSWIRERFGRVIQASVELVLGPDVSVELIAADAPVDAGGGSTRPRRRPADPGATARRTRSRSAAPGRAGPSPTPS